MNTKWGRDESYHWPSNKPVWTITALLLAVAAMMAMAVYQYQRQWTLLQQEYLETYISSAARVWPRAAYYQMIYRIDRKKERFAVNEDLSDPAVLSGKAKLQWERGTYNNRLLNDWLQTEIYGGQSPLLLLWAPAWKVGVGVFVVAFVFAIPRDYKRQRIRKYGRRTKGPELMTAAQFNRRQQQSANGIGFAAKERRTLGEFLLGREGKVVHVARVRESSHFMMMGDTGTGKSSLIRQILVQVEKRGETAIVYDPALEYTSQFYEPRRGGIGMGDTPPRMALYHESPGVPRATAATGMHVAGHAGASHDEPGQARSAPGVVHLGRASKPSCLAAVAHGDHGEP